MSECLKNIPNLHCKDLQTPRFRSSLQHGERLPHHPCALSGAVRFLKSDVGILALPVIRGLVLPIVLPNWIRISMTCTSRVTVLTTMPLSASCYETYWSWASIPVAFKLRGFNAFFVDC